MPPLRPSCWAAAASCCALAWAAPAHAQQPDAEQDDEAIDFGAIDLWSVLPLEFEVLGPNERDRRDEPGSAHILDAQAIERTAPIHAAEIIDQLPGTVALDEDGMSLRLNLGLRGLDPRLSRYTLVLEDGVPIAPSLYLDGATLYLTPAERLERVELLKGSGAILHGPRNMAGVLALVTHQPPPSFTARARVLGGSYGRLSAHAMVGDVQGVVGYLLEANHRRFQGPRSLDLEATDVAAKFRLQVSTQSWFSAKLSIYNEFSRRTDLGLTQPLFERAPSTLTSPYDRDELDRYAASLTHSTILTDSALLQTTVWATRFGRDQQQQRALRAPDSFDRIERELPDPVEGSAPGGSLSFLDATDVEQRLTQSAGAETRLTLDVPMGKVGRTELLVGARGMIEDTEFDQSVGEHGGSPAGARQTLERLDGQALAAYSLARFFLFDDRVRVTPGVRLELLTADRTLWRVPDVDAPALGRDLNPPVERSGYVSALLPGVGASWDVIAPLTLFAGIHRGMAPDPMRVALSDDRQDGDELTPATSWQMEAGAKASWREWAQLDVTGFWMEYDHLNVLQATAQGEPLLATGSARALGVETQLQIEPLRLLSTALRAPIRAAYTLTDATTRSDFGLDLVQKRALPYAPMHQGTLQLAFIHPLGFEAVATGRLMGRHVTDLENTIAPAPSGLRGLISRRTWLDLKLAYTHAPWEMTVFLIGKSVTHDVTIASRRPLGIQPTGWREAMGGVEVDF